MSSEAAAQEQIRGLLEDGIRHLIEAMVHDGGVRTGPEVARLFRNSPNSGLLPSEPPSGLYEPPYRLASPSSCAGLTGGGVPDPLPVATYRDWPAVTPSSLTAHVLARGRQGDLKFSP
jgi:hypothetical protein